MKTIEVGVPIRGTEVPVPDIEVHDGPFVRAFFRGLFENYGLEEPRNELNVVMPYQHELVIPRQATKPLVVVRGGYEVVDPPTEEHSIGWAEWKTIGQYYYKVLTEPTQTGSFIEKLSVTDPRLIGYGSSYPDEEVEYPERPFNQSGDWKSRWDRMKDWKFSILQDVVELIS